MAEGKKEESKTKTKAKKTTKKKSSTTSPSTKLLCHCCGKPKSEREFYTTPYKDSMWQINNRKTAFCRSCLEAEFTAIKDKYGEMAAALCCCHMIDAPWDQNAYISLTKDDKPFQLGNYLKTFNTSIWDCKSFFISLLDSDLIASQNEINEQRESHWSRDDMQCREFCLRVVGYDPFQNCSMSQEDRKKGFHILSDYLDMEGVRDDRHKIQSAVQITLAEVQRMKIDEILTNEMAKPHSVDSKIKDLQSARKNLIDTITRTAKENSFTKDFDYSGRGRGTFTDKQKELELADFEPIKVNLYDIKTSEAMQQIMALSNEKIMESIGDGEWQGMVKEQREIIQKLYEERDALQEELRQYKNQEISEGW